MKRLKYYGSILLTYPATKGSKNQIKKRFMSEAMYLFEDMYKKILKNKNK